MCNLKAAKMRGVESQAMVLCGESADGATVELVEPPAGAQPGDRVSVEGFPGEPDEQLNPKASIRVHVHACVRLLGSLCDVNGCWRSMAAEEDLRGGVRRVLLGRIARRDVPGQGAGDGRGRLHAQDGGGGQDSVDRAFLRRDMHRTLKSR